MLFCVAFIIIGFRIHTSECSFEAQKAGLFSYKFRCGTYRYDTRNGNLLLIFCYTALCMCTAGLEVKIARCKNSPLGLSWSIP
jgi:hypothetical protein